MTAVLFDKLAFTDRLKRAGISDEHARAHGEAMDEALRESVATKLDVARLEHKLEIVVRDLTIRVGGMLIALFGALAAIKYFGP